MHFLLSLATKSLLVAVIFCENVAAARKKPNVLFFLSDDQGSTAYIGIIFRNKQLICRRLAHAFDEFHAKRQGDAE
jgi:hypothetical protein